MNVPDESFVLPAGLSARLFGYLGLGIVGMISFLMLLPNNPYYRWQQGDGTILFRARYIYDRIHNDTRPIDVAMIGSSRMEASVRANELSIGLSRKLGRPITVVNFGLPQEGRDLHWTIARELLINRPETKLLVLSAGSEATLSHPGFRFLGDDESIASAPIFYNPYYVENILTLPYRHLAYFVQSLWPWAFQLSPIFDAEIYRQRSFDPSETFTMADGAIVDRTKELDPRTIARQAVAVANTRGDDPKLRYLPIDNRYPIERSYLRRIAALARSKGVTVAFLRVPTFRAEEHFEDPSFYGDIGPLMNATQLGADAFDYADLGHLNRRGSGRLSPWLIDEMTPLVRGAEERP